MVENAVENLQPRLPGVVVYRGPVGWPAVVDAFLAGHGESTAKSYRGDLARWSTWCAAAAVDPLHADRTDVERFRRDEEISRAPATVKRRLAAIAGVYKWCVVEGLLERNPAEYVRRPHVDDDSPTRGLDVDEMRQLQLQSVGAGPLEAAFIYLLCQAGLRVSEACAADVTDVRVEQGHRVLHVTRKGGKRRSKVLNPVVAKAIDGHIGGRRRGPLFVRADGRRLDRYSARRIVMRLAERAGIDGAVTTHSLRHGFATVGLDREGVELQDVQDAMDHADPRTTMRYVRARRRLERDPTHALGRLFEAD